MFPEFPDFLLVDVLRGGVLPFEGLQLDLELGLYLVDLVVFEDLDLLELVLKAVDLAQQLFPLVVEFRCKA